MSYYMHSLLNIIISFIPNKKLSYVGIVNDAYKDHKSPFLVTLLINLPIFLVTLTIDILLGIYAPSYLMTMCIHLLLSLYFVLHFNMYRNNLLFCFSYLFMIISIFVFKYWSFTLLFVIFTTYYLLDVINSKKI